jgi:hypothetical protein
VIVTPYILNCGTTSFETFKFLHVSFGRVANNPTGPDAPFERPHQLQHIITLMIAPVRSP